jgi:hypothetical protein
MLKRRLLVNFVGSTLIGIAMLVTALVLFVVWAGVERLIGEHRAQTFCDAFAVGETTSLERVQDLLKDKSSYHITWTGYVAPKSVSFRELPPASASGLDTSSLFVTIRTLAGDYTCGLDIVDWKVTDKKFTFDDY